MAFRVSRFVGLAKPKRSKSEIAATNARLAEKNAAPQMDHVTIVRE